MLIFLKYLSFIWYISFNDSFYQVSIKGKLKKKEIDAID